MAEPTITTTTTTITTTQPNLLNQPQPPPPPPPPPLPPIKLTSSLTAWGTLEELLLACAVNRHGTNSWDAVAKELNNRRTCRFTPHICRLKYLDLKRRFAADESSAVEDDTAGVEDETAVWLDELRRLRVAELKRDLHRYDVSIVSLQLKVKKLKEEREKSVKEEVEVTEVKVKGKEKREDDVVKEEEEERENSDLNKNEERETPTPPPAENGRRNDESSNESNSTDPKPEPDTEPVKSEPDRCVEPVRRADSCNGSSNSKESGERGTDQGERVERVDSGELEVSAAESRREEEEEEEVKESSDVQSTASLRRREKKMRVVSGNSSGDENQSPASKFSFDKEGGKRQTQALVDFLDLVRARKFGSVFERRLESQDNPRYKRLIKEHIDLGIIQKRVEEGQYLDCHTMFYRDLMLLINNAIVFFSKRSSEHKAANELRELVNEHFQTQLNNKKGQTLKSILPAALPKPTAKPEVDQADHTDLKPKLAMTGPVIACRKRSSIAGKLSSAEAEKKESSATTVKAAAVAVLKQEGEKSSSTSFNAVTKKRTRDQNSGVRSSASKNQNSSSRSSRPSSGTSQKPSPRTVLSKGDNSEGKADVKKPSAGNSSSKSKQGSRASKDLLLDVLDSAAKRKIFGNGSSSGNAKSEKHKDQGRGSHNVTNKKPSTEKGKGKEERESSRNRSLGRPPKRAAAMSAVGKRGRDGGRDTDSHSKKRQRR